LFWLISCGEKSCGDWCSGKEHAAHLVSPQYHTGGEVTLIPCCWKGLKNKRLRRRACVSSWISSQAQWSHNRVTRMASSPRLWLMAIGWWNKINQCRKLKLNLTQIWGVYEFWFRYALISKSVILWWQVKKGINSELEGASARGVLNSFKKVSVSHAQLANFSTLSKEKHMLLILNFSTLTFITMLEPPCHLQDK
jgi:hypothetical protein